MSDTATGTQGFIDEDHSQEPVQASKGLKSRLGGRRNLIIAACAGLLVLGGLGYWATSALGLAGESEPDPGEVARSMLYYDLPEMVVNLAAGEQRAQYLKLKVALEVQDPEVLATLEPVMPRVLDLFQLYLRGLRSSDLEGSAGLFRLKEELLRRINLEVQPGKVNRVLFKEIIVQ